VTKKSQRKKTSSKGGKQENTFKGKQKAGVANGEEGRAPALQGMLRHHSSASSSVKSDRSQLVDLVVEDTAAEDAERVRARKEGSAGWNKAEARRYVRTYGQNTGEDIREGYDIREEVAVDDDRDRFSIDGADDDDEGSPDDSEESKQWKQAREGEVLLQPKYGLAGEDLQNPWDGAEAEGGAPRENP